MTEDASLVSRERHFRVATQKSLRTPPMRMARLRVRLYNKQTGHPPHIHWANQNLFVEQEVISPPLM